jgi:hypothetical protein
MHHRFHVEQTCRWPSSPDPPGAAPPSPGRTLHHESPDPSGDPISTLEADVDHGRADAMGRVALRVGSAPRSPPLRQTSLLGGPPSDPWEGRHHKTRSHVGCICIALSTLMDPLHRRWPPDGNVDPPLLTRLMTSAAANGDPSPTAWVPPIPGVVTGCLEYCCDARVWLQDQLSGVVTDYL